MEFDAGVLIAAPLVIFFAYLVFGMTGFGSSIIAVPLLAHFLPLQFVVPMMVLLDISASVLLGAKAPKQVSRAEMKWLIPFAVAGMIAGVTLLIKLPKELLLLSLGVFVLGYGILSIIDPRSRRIIGRSWVVPTGLVGGTFTALFGTGGPVYAIYLSRRLADVSELRSTMSAVIMITAVVRIVFFVVTGLLLQLKLLGSALALLPVAALGLKAGSRVHVRMSQDQMRLALGYLLLMSGVSLLWKVLG